MFMLKKYLRLAKDTETIQIDLKENNLTEEFIKIIREKEKKENMSFCFYGFKSALHYLDLKYDERKSIVLAQDIVGEVLTQTFKAEEYPVNMMDHVLCVGESLFEEENSKFMKTNCFLIEIVNPKLHKLRRYARK